MSEREQAMQQAEDVLRREFTNESVKEAAGILYSVGITPKEAVAFIERRKPQLVAAVDPAFQDYNNYLTAIFRPTDTLCFVGIVHNSDKGKEHVANDFVPFEKAVTREYYDHLKDENSAGSIYVATNTFPSSLIGLKAGRTQENVVEVRAVQADVDYNGAATIEAIKTSAAVPQPSIIVESSPGKFQGIWLVDGISKQDAKPLMQGIAATFQTDSAVAEVARVMRVPGFVNRKYESAPVAKTLLQTNQRYRREQFKVAIPESKFETKAENWVNDVVVTHGNAYNDLLSLAGYYVRQKNINDSEMLYKLLAGHCENAVDRDGKTPWQPDLEQVRVYAEKWAAEFETKESYDSRTKLALTQQPTPGSPAAQAAAPAIDVSDWRSLFRSIGEMEDGPIDMIIEGALQEGTCFLGATAGDGKTLVALAFAKAISTGTALFDLPQFGVKIPRPVIYLIPESRDRAFRKRCEAFKLPDDKTKFMTRTISAGRPLELSDPRLVEAVRQTKAVVFLDTASRFMKGTDENSATQNQLLVNDVITLLAAGAVCVVLLHHANKSSKQNKESMTLENMLRGTSDFAAMCDQAYGIRKDMTVYAHGSGPMEIELVSLKDREQIGGLTSIRLAASYKVKITAEGRFESQYPKSWITETGNFRVMSDMETGRRESQNIENAVKADPNIPAKDIALALGISEYRVKSTLEHLKYHRVKGGPGGASPWHQDVGGVCPYDKVVEVKPSKKKLDSTVTEVVAELGKLLATTNVDADETIPETQVLSWADGKGITDVVLNKARRRLGVVLGRDGNIKTWSLPAAATPPAEPAASQQADVPEAF